MESANSHHQLQDQLLIGSNSSSLATPPCYGVGSSTAHPWSIPTSILNTNGLSSSYSYPIETRQQQENATLLSSMAPDLGSFHWANNNTPPNFTTYNILSPQDLQLSRINSDHYYRKYTEILRSSSPQSTTTTDEYEHRSQNLQENDNVGTKQLLLKSFSSGNHGDLSSANGGRSGFMSQIIFPTINISNLNQHQPTSAGSNLDMNLEALDLLASSRFSGNFAQSSQNQTGLFRDIGFSNYAFDHMQQPHQIPLYSSNKVSASSNVVGEGKRTSGKMEPKEQFQNAPKKSRLEARSSCPPFKVRKEKLGDRIAALQQLVAPFGKTDTASVLMEAIGYIKFLQSQVETLSVPYMKPSRSKSSRVMKGGPAENETEETKRDLKSRGLCLVPLSCLSYITDGGGAAVWPPPHFGGAT